MFWVKLVSEVLENDTLLFIFTVPVELIVRMQMMLQKPHTSKCVYALVLAKDVNWLECGMLQETRANY